MTQHADTSADARRDASVERYVLALDAGDFAAAAAVLAEAETDPVLDRLLTEVDEALHAESDLPTGTGQDTAANDQTAVPSPGAGDGDEPAQGQPTVADVASRIHADHAAGRHLLLADDQEANDLLRTNRTRLIGPLPGQRMRQLVDGLGVTASRRYWGLFQHMATVLLMAHDAGDIRVAAARTRPTGTSRLPTEQE